MVIFFYVSRNGQRSPGGFRTKNISHQSGVRKTALTWRDKNLNILSKEEALAVKNDDMQTQFNINSKYKEIQGTADSFRSMKDAIRKYRNKYSGIFENIQDVYYETSLEGVILEISPSIEKIYRNVGIPGAKCRGQAAGIQRNRSGYDGSLSSRN
jgi:PAS domain-containing protein